MGTIELIWLIIFISLLSLCGFVFYKIRNYKVLLSSLFLAILVPCLYVIFECSQNITSDDCLLGKSLLHTYIVIFAIYLSTCFYLVVSFVHHFYKKFITRHCP